MARERELREEGILDLPLRICGVTLHPLWLIDYAALSACGSPFFCGGPITNGDVFAFLWRLSFEYAPRDNEARDAFTARLAEHTFLEIGNAGNQIAEYLEGVFIDNPGGGGRGEAPIGSFLASVIDCFAREYGWTAEQIENTSLVRVYQLFRFIQRSSGTMVPLFNRLSDKARQAYAAAWGCVPEKRRAAWLQRQVDELRAED